MAVTVLVVDDEPSVVRLLQATLEGKGYTVRTAYSGTEALKEIKSAAPDLIVLDAMMPDMDGWATLQTLKATPAAAHIPVIMCTAKDSMGDVERGFQSGAAAYVTKPLDLQRFLKKVESLVRERPADNPGR